MTPLFHFNYNNDRHQNIFISTPIILLILLLLSRGRMFSFVEEEKEAKINLERDEALNGEIRGDDGVKQVKIEEKEGEQQQESEEKSHSTISQKQQVPESSTKSSSGSPLELPIESTSAQPQVSSSSTTSPTATPTTLSITQQQEEDSTQQHPHSKRNYASKECGAKVLYSNEEAENKGAILNDPERDDYMRNPCERAQNKFLIIELCEIIQLNSFEIANFELFSSNPKDFRLWGSERYPTQEWILIGDFEAQNIRKLQSFDVKQQNTLYIRFVKLELLTHYGNEHFCTLSTFVVYGTSIIEEYEAEVASSSTTIQQQQFTSQIDENLNKKEEINSTNVTTINETIKECSKIQEENEQQKIPKNGLNKKKNEINFTTKNATNEEKKEEKLEKEEIGGGGNMLKTIVEQLGSNIKNVIGQAFSKNNNGNEEKEKNKKDVFNRRKNVLRYTFTSCQQCFSTKHASTLNYLTLFCWAFFPNIYRIIKHKQQYLFDSTKKFNGANKFQNYFLDKVLRRQTSSFCPLPSLPLTCSNRKSETNNVGQQKQQNKQQLNSNVVENVGVKLQQQQKVTPTLVDEKVSRPLPGTSTNSKESIFMKLNKRISLLEQNFSISNEHLNELNKKTTKTEEFIARQEKISKTTSENVAKHEQKINELQKELRRLSQQLSSVATSIQPTTIRPDGNGFYPPPPLSQYQRYMNSEKQQNQCNGKTCMSDFRSSYISPSTYYSQLRNAIGYGREDEVNVRQEGLWTVNFKKFQNI
uniref:SUN domain-containing protein n=1 Tax=Meloidogyne incognita TaxID=6306 RepID=A0A914M131_MELIC